MLKSRAPLTYRAPLPALPPLEIDEIIPIVPLMTKCINITSPKEQNDLLKKVISLWKEQRSQMMKVKRENIEKNAIYNQLQHRLEQRRDEYQTLLEETEFYRDPSNLKQRKPLSYFVESIKEAEQLRAKFQPFNSRRKQSRVLNTFEFEKKTKRSLMHSLMQIKRRKNKRS